MDNTDRLTPSDSPHSQLLPGSRYAMPSALFQEQFVDSYTKSCFTTGTPERGLEFTNSIMTSNQIQESSVTSGQRWFVSSPSAPSYEADVDTAALLSYTTVGVKSLPFTSTSGSSNSLDYYTSTVGWDSRGLLENGSKTISNLSGWVLDATLERSMQPNYLPDGELVERSSLGVSEELGGKDVDSTWTDTQSSIKSVDSSDLRILEEAPKDNLSIHPDSEVQAAEDVQNRARNGIKESGFFHFDA